MLALHQSTIRMAVVFAHVNRSLVLPACTHWKAPSLHGAHPNRTSTAGIDAAISGRSTTRLCRSGSRIEERRWKVRPYDLPAKAPRRRPIASRILTASVYGGPILRAGVSCNPIVAQKQDVLSVPMSCTRLRRSKRKVAKSVWLCRSRGRRPVLSQELQNRQGAGLSKESSSICSFK
jgi:hypothetical protein